MLLLPLSGLWEGWAAWGLRVRWPAGDVPRSPLCGKQCWYLGFWHWELCLVLHQLLSSGSW